MPPTWILKGDLGKIPPFAATGYSRCFVADFNPLEMVVVYYQIDPDA